MLPYSGQITFGQIQSEFGASGAFNLSDAMAGTYGALNPCSYIQPTGGPPYSPDHWYGYDGRWIVTSGLILNYDAFPPVGSYPSGGPIVTDLSVDPIISDGTLMNDTYWDPNYGGSFTFDGTDDHIRCTQVPNPLSTFSVEIWINATSGSWAIGAGAGQSIFNVDDWNSANSWLLHPNATAGSTSMTFYVNSEPIGTSTIVSATTAVNLTAGNWYHVVGTFGPLETKIYLNGALSGTGGGGPAVVIHPASHIVVGGDPRYDFRRITGNIAAFRMYDIELSAADVVQNWDAARGRFGL
jgi:hypothetical protein